jgi:hypothetical protein
METDKNAIMAIILKMVAINPFASLELFKAQGLMPVLFKSNNDRTTKTSRKISVTKPRRYNL